MEMIFWIKETEKTQERYEICKTDGMLESVNF